MVGKHPIVKDVLVDQNGRKEYVNLISLQFFPRSITMFCQCIILAGWDGLKVTTPNLGDRLAIHKTHLSFQHLTTA